MSYGILFVFYREIAIFFALMGQFPAAKAYLPTKYIGLVFGCIIALIAHLVNG